MALLNTSSLSLYLVLVAMEMDLIGLLHLFLAQTELTLLDVPKAVAWVGKSIVACIKKDLYLINVRSTVGFAPFPCGITPLSPPPPPQTDTGDTKELFSIGANRTEPCLLQLTRGEILILKDDLQVSREGLGRR